jgi:hypothetical protein
MYELDDLKNILRDSTLKLYANDSTLFENHSDEAQGLLSDEYGGDISLISTSSWVRVAFSACLEKLATRKLSGLSPETITAITNDYKDALASVRRRKLTTPGITAKSGLINGDYYA